MGDRDGLRSWDGKAGRPSPPSWRGLLDDATASGAQIQTMRDLYGKDFK